MKACALVRHLQQCSSSGELRAPDNLAGIQVIIGASCKVKGQQDKQNNRTNKQVLNAKDSQTH